LPPGVTPEQFAMKSDRQFERIALVCAAEGCCACAPFAKNNRSQTEAPATQ
jgi:hypothetical protein